MMTQVFLWILISQVDVSQPESMTYGDIFFEETRDSSLPDYFLNLGYASDTSGAFLDLPSINSNIQIGLHQFVSTGLLSQLVFARLTESAQSLSKLRDIDINFDVSKPKWSIFSLTQVQIFLGQWNLWNLASFQVEMLVGGGFGFIKRKEHFSAKSQNQWSHLWHLEQRLRISDHWGLQIALFGHRGAMFLQSGATLSF